MPKNRIVFDTLYGLSSTGKKKVWMISVVDNETYSTIVTSHGYVGQTITVTEKNIYSGKNCGKKNETTHFEQAVSEAESAFNKKIDKQYARENQQVAEAILPMLAHDYRKRSHDIVFPCYVQPKLDGCLHHASKILTKKGVMTLGEIVDNKLNVEVLSYNESTGESEYKPVVNWFDNGESDKSEWIEISTEYGVFIKCTLNHKIYTNLGWVAAAELDSNIHKILSKNVRLNSLLAGTILGDSTFSIDNRSRSYRLEYSHNNKTYFDFKMNLFGIPGSVKDVVSGYGYPGHKFVSTALTKSSFDIDSFYCFDYNEDNLGSRRLMEYSLLRKMITPEALSLWIADDGSLRLNNNNPLTPVLSISVMRYSDAQVDEFIRLFASQKYQCLPTKVPCVKKDALIGYSLVFNTKDTLYLLNMLRKYHCKGVEYKYYFPTEDYISNCNMSEFISFTKKSIRHVNGNIRKLDIEVADNHNYYANGILVHNCRCTANFDNSLSSFKCTSRGGKNFGAVGSIIDSINKSIPGSLFIFDGELYSHELTFQEIMSAIKNEEEPDPNISKIKYWIYDICDPAIGFAARNAAIEKLKPLLDPDKIVIVPTFLVNNEEEMFAKHAEFISQGYEGTMVRNANGSYVFKHRSANLQKVKDFVDSEFEIIGGEEGCGLSEGQCTFKCKTADGLEFGVRCIGENSVREEQWANLDNYIGKMLKVKYQRLSDDGLPIFPVGISVRSEYE